MAQFSTAAQEFTSELVVERLDVAVLPGLGKSRLGELSCFLLHTYVAGFDIVAGLCQLVCGWCR